MDATLPEYCERVTSSMELARASLPALLLYGLTLDDDDPGLGVLLGARGDLGLLVSLAQNGSPGVAEIDLADLAEGMERLGRRLDVAIELLTRGRRIWTSDKTQAREPVYDKATP